MPETSSLPVSVHILTFNSAATIGAALVSVVGCAEILVIDGGSTDDTLRIARKHGAILVPQRNEGQGTPLEDFAAARNRGLARTTQPWVLSLDSDETASKELMKDVAATVKRDDADACYVPRRYVLPDGRVVRKATTYPNERLYFFRTDAVEKWIKPVHERPQLKTDARIAHFQGWSLAPLGTPEEYWEKNLRYIALEAKRSANDGWGRWFGRVVRALRGRVVATLRLAWIWLIPLPGPRLPLQYEGLRYRYAWKLLWETRPRPKRT